MMKYYKLIKIFAIGLAVFIIANILSIVLFFFSAFGSFSGYKGNVQNFEQTYDNVEKIDIDIQSAKITIRRGTEFKVVAKGFKNHINSTQLGEKLTIKESGKFFPSNKPNAEIIVYINRTVNLTDLKVNSGVGSVFIDGITSDDFELTQGVGIVKINKSFFNETEISGGTGETKITDSILKNLDLSAGVGSIFIEADISGNSSIECGVGQIELVLLGGESKYTIKSEKGIGSININGSIQKDDSIYGGGPNRVDLEGGIGSIKVSFR